MATASRPKSLVRCRRKSSAILLPITIYAVVINGAGGARTPLVDTDEDRCQRFVAKFNENVDGNAVATVRTIATTVQAAEWPAKGGAA